MALVSAGFAIVAGALRWHWMVVAAWEEYRSARQNIAGLDQIVVGMLVLALALLVSLTKIGIPQRWLAAARGKK